MNSSRTWIISGIIGIIIGLLISPLLYRGNTGMMSGAFGVSRGGYMMADIDRRFIEEMIPHHVGAIEMAELALEKSQRPEILSLANGIIEAQQKEIDDMEAWYLAWFGTQVPASSSYMMGGHMSSMGGDLETLRQASDFDLEFIRQMIPHHEMAVMMAQMLRTSTDRAEMRVLADNIITSQTREIAMMRSWASSWSR